MEDFNLPSTERTILLKNLQEEIGDVPPYFWAICQVCDLQALGRLIEVARISPPIVRVLATQAYSMVLYWTQSNQYTSRTPTPKKPQLRQGLGSSSTGSPLVKRQNTNDSPSSPSQQKTNDPPSGPPVKRQNTNDSPSSPSQQKTNDSPSGPPVKRQKTNDSPSGPLLAERQTTTRSPIGLPLLQRSKRASELARERDGHRCVLSGDMAIEVAHIYPFCRLSTTEVDVFGPRHMFWEHLKNFWSKEKVTAWEQDLFPRGLSGTGDERVDNRITLSNTAHVHWNRGAFALKPISMSNDNTTLKIQFFWQRKQPDIQATMSLLTIPLSTEGLDYNDGAYDHGQTSMMDFLERKLIKSGDTFDLKTDDPTRKPLPNFKLLELQWCLARVIGMAGAAFPYELNARDDSDEDLPDLYLDEVEGTSVISDVPQHTQELLYEVNRVLKHHAEEAEGDEVGLGRDNVSLRIAN